MSNETTPADQGITASMRDRLEAIEATAESYRDPLDNILMSVANAIGSEALSDFLQESPKEGSFFDELFESVED